MFFLTMVLVFSLGGLAQAKSVLIVTCATEGQQAAIDQIDPAVTKVFESQGHVVIHGPAAQNVLSQAGVAVGPSNALDTNQLVAIGKAANADYVVGAIYHVWSRTHLAYRDGRCSVSANVVDVQSGTSIDRQIAEQHRALYQNEEALAMRGAAFGLGTTVAVGGFPNLTHWSVRHPVRYRVLGWTLSVVSLIPFESHSDVQTEAVRKATKQVFEPIAKQM